MADDFDWSSRKAKRPLCIIIVGAGLGGLASALALQQTGHHVTVLEHSKEIREVGAGIQIPPNSNRILSRLGLGPRIARAMSITEMSLLRRWQDGAELSTTPMTDVRTTYGAALGAIHRGDFQRILLEACIKAGVAMRTGCTVIKVDESFEARVLLESGEWVEGDLIVAADGVKSKIRKQMAAATGTVDRATPTGDAAWRLTISRDKLVDDVEALKLIDNPIQTRWIGPQSHVVGYPVKQGQVFNMVLLHPARPDDSGDESWTRKGDKQEMIDFYKDWNPFLRRLISYAPPGDVMEWTLYTHTPLPTWIANKVVGIGDAVHPMLPYAAQGAAQAVEDAAVLAAVFTCTGDIKRALLGYERIRKGRGESLQRSGAGTRETLHLPDGPEQIARDAGIRATANGKGDPAATAANKAFMADVWGRDVMRECVEGWDKLDAELDQVINETRDLLTHKMIF